MLIFYRWLICRYLYLTITQLKDNIKNMNQVRWGIIGPGQIAHRFADGLKEVLSGKLVAIASKTQDRRSLFGNKYNIDPLLRFKTYDEIIQSSEVDAIYISTPHTLHAEWTIKAVKKGKHVLCEKPAAINYTEGKKVIDAVKSTNVFYMEGFMYRCHPQIAKLISLIENNIIGDITSIQASFGFDIGKINPDSRLFNIHLAGGSILDVGVYPVSFSRLIAGIVSGKNFLNPYKIKGTATIGETNVDEIAYATLYFDNGILAEISTAILKNMDDTAIVKGTKGSLSLTNPWTPGKDGGPYKSSIIVNIEGQQEIIEVKGIEHLFAFEAEVASRAIIEKRNEALPPAMTWDDTLGNLATLDQWRKKIGYKLPQETS